ncbi:MAG TPA: alginate lyase family protein [Desulfuromonadaceae bacterium]|nr:alginate lyase family protein [Desulfuromonadaceae bacterium]
MVFSRYLLSLSNVRFLLCLWAVTLAGSVHAAGSTNTAARPATNRPALTPSATNRTPLTPSTAAMPPAVTTAPTNAAAPFDVAAVEHDRILNMAMNALTAEPVTITKYHAEYSQGTANDFFSQGDSWFPDTNSDNGLPFRQHAGQINPDNFNNHKLCLMNMRDNVAALAAAYKITGNNRYASVAAEWLRVFFLDPATRMNPNLAYAQAVPGVYKGRIIGISDVAALIEIPKAVETLQASSSFPPEVVSGMKQWATNYLDWLTGSTNGDEVAELGNNHTIAYWLHVAAYAKFIDDQDRLDSCNNRFKLFLLPTVSADGSFGHIPKMRSYSTSVTVAEYMGAACQILSTPDNNLWQFAASNGRTFRSMFEFIYLYLDDPSKWTKPMESDEKAWPPREACMVFAGLAYNEPKYLALWKKMHPDPTREDVRRYVVVSQPVLWINNSIIAGQKTSGTED